MYLLDTNILIYLLKDDKKIGQALSKLKQNRFSISIVSRLEVLMGTDKEKHSMSQLEEYLDFFKNINLDKKVVREAVSLARKSQNRLKFKDLIIAATSKINKCTLITCDKDFKKLVGVKVKYFL